MPRSNVWKSNVEARRGIVLERKREKKRVESEREIDREKGGYERRGESFTRVPKVAASRTRRTYAKSNSSTYVPVAETAETSCIFSVFVAECSLR